VSKFLGFLLGVVVALAGPAVFGVLAAPGGIELNAKEMALAFGIGALVFWAVVSYFSGAGALGAFIAFATLIYCWLWIPNRTTNFLNDVPGVTNGMIDGTKQYTLNGVVPILAVISLVYAIQLIVRGVQRRRRERAEEDRLQREQDAAQAQQEADVAAVYPVAGSTYPETGAYSGGYGNSTRYDDLFDDEPEPVRPRNQADEHTSQYPTTTSEHTREFAEEDAAGNDVGEETVLVPTNADETVQVPTNSPFAPEQPQAAQEAPEADTDEEVTQPAARPEVDEDATQLAPRVEAEEAAAPEAPQAPVVKEGAPAAKTPEAKTAPTPPEVKQEEPRAAKAPEVREAPASPEVAEAPVENPPKAPKAEMQRAPLVGAKEQVGSQYRERMDNPEDTGEFHLTAFENPVVRPAGA
jgi:type II secretory pathway pseudopilin PulG